MVMSQAAPTPVIRQPGFGTSSPPPNPFLSGIQENLSRLPPTALSSQFNTHPANLVPNFPPPTTFPNFVTSTPHVTQNKHPTRKKVILPQSDQSSSSEASHHKNINKKSNNSKKGKKGVRSPIYESINSSSESSQRRNLAITSSPTTMLPSVTTSAPAPPLVSRPIRSSLLMSTGEPMDPDMAAFIAAAVQTMNVTAGTSEQLQEHADLHGAMLAEIYEKLRKKS